MRKAIFFDRDGIINEVNLIDGKPYPPKNLHDIRIIPGIREIMHLAMRFEYLVIVVTNQPDVGKSKRKRKEVEKINQYLMDNLPIDEFFVCWHKDADNCECRKPKVGLFLQAQTKYNIDFSKSYVVGDRWKDIEAGQSLGCKTVFVNYNYNEKQPANPTYTVKYIY